MKPIRATKDQTIARQVVVAWWSCLLFAAVVLTIVQHALTLPRPFTYPHAWGAAAAVVDARAFRLSGIAALKAVPMHNNPPYGVHPEAYVHWPPLLALLLTFWFNLFGESETSTHAFTFALYMLTTGLLYWMISANLGRLAAVIGTLSWLTMPVTLRYSHVILNETLGLPFVILALMAVPRALADSPSRRRWQAAGAAATACAVLASWHFVFVPVGLLAAARWNQGGSERRIAVSYLCVAMGAAVAVLTWYMVAYPDLWADTLHAVAYRLGVGKTYSISPLHSLAGAYPTMSIAATLQAEVLNVVRMIGPLALIGLAAFCVDQARRWKQRPADTSLLLFCGWIFPPLLWFAIFRNQSAIHEFTTILLAPIAVYALAACVVKLMDRLAATGGTVALGGYWAFAIFAPLLLLVPLARQIHGSVQIHSAPGQVLPIIEPSPSIMAPDDYVNFGLAIRENSAPMSVVLTPELSAVPLYYSWRHLIQGVNSDTELAGILPIVRREFGKAPIYLALLDKDRGKFPALIGSATPNESNTAIIIRMPE